MNKKLSTKTDKKAGVTFEDAPQNQDNESSPLKNTKRQDSQNSFRMKKGSSITGKDIQAGKMEHKEPKGISMMEKLSGGKKEEVKEEGVEAG